MNINALIIESDRCTAETLLDRIESTLYFRCTIATEFKGIQAAFRAHSGIQYSFIVYDVTSSKEQLREQLVAAYIHKNYPEVSVCSIGSIKNKEVTFTEEKILLFDSNDIKDLYTAPTPREAQHKNLNLKRRLEGVKLGGACVLY